MRKEESADSIGNNCSCVRFDIRNVREGERGTGRVMEDLGFVFIHTCFWSGNRLRLFELGCGCGFIPET